MNKTDLISSVAAEANISVEQANKALEVFCKTIIQAVAENSSVAIAGFGTFKAHDRAARIGKNPRTGKTIEIAEKRLPRFQPGTVFKMAVSRAKKA